MPRTRDASPGATAVSFFRSNPARPPACEAPRAPRRGEHLSAPFVRPPPPPPKSADAFEGGNAKSFIGTRIEARVRDRYGLEIDIREAQHSTLRHRPRTRAMPPTRASGAATSRPRVNGALRRVALSRVSRRTTGPSVCNVYAVNARSNSMRTGCPSRKARYCLFPAANLADSRARTGNRPPPPTRNEAEDQPKPTTASGTTRATLRTSRFPDPFAGGVAHGIEQSRAPRPHQRLDAHVRAHAD
jgi:hypothetical protein